MPCCGSGFSSMTGRNSCLRTLGRNGCRRGSNYTGCNYCGCSSNRAGYFWYVTNGSYAGRNRSRNCC